MPLNERAALCSSVSVKPPVSAWQAVGSAAKKSERANIKGKGGTDRRREPSRPALLLQLGQGGGSRLLPRDP